MNLDNKEEEFYKKLEGQLLETASWPSEYLFKFIVQSEGNRVKQVEYLFDGLGAVIKTTPSKGGKYTSLSIHVTMKDPQQVVAKYKEVGSKVEGLISL